MRLPTLFIKWSSTLEMFYVTAVYYVWEDKGRRSEPEYVLFFFSPDAFQRNHGFVRFLFSSLQLSHSSAVRRWRVEKYRVNPNDFRFAKGYRRVQVCMRVPNSWNISQIPYSDLPFFFLWGIDMMKRNVEEKGTRVLAIAESGEPPRLTSRTATKNLFDDFWAKVTATERYSR